MKTLVSSCAVLGIAGLIHAVPTATSFDINAGGGATFTGFDIVLGDDALNYLTSAQGDVFVITDATIGGAVDAYDGMFEIGVGIGGGQYTISDDDGIVDVVAGASGTRVEIDAVSGGAAPLPSGFSFAAEYFVFANDPLLRVVFSVTNNTGAAADVQVEFGSDSGSFDLDLETSSGDNVLGADDSYYVISDGGGGSDPLQSYTQYGVGAAVTASMAGQFSSDDTNVLFDLSLAAGETQSLMLFAGVTDPNSPTALADALALISPLDGTLEELGALGFLDGLGSGVQDTIVNYAVPSPGSLSLLAIGGLAASRRRR